MPDQEHVTEQSIVPGHIGSMGTMIHAALMDEIKAFAVIDVLVDQLLNGRLPLSAGDAASALWEHWRTSRDRMSWPERRSLYALTMGFPSVEPLVRANVEFNPLWLRFACSVTSLNRLPEPDQQSRQLLRNAAIELSVNVSAHLSGSALFAAKALDDDIGTIMGILSDGEIKACYGARDMWHLISQVAVMELGGARLHPRFKTLASAGLTISAWLAQNITRLASASATLTDFRLMLQPNRFDPARTTGVPTDAQLVEACERWVRWSPGLWPFGPPPTSVGQQSINERQVSTNR